MALFNAITLEQNALKRAKIERRRGPKPARVAFLWAHTSWLDAPVQVVEGRVLFAGQTRSRLFEGALLEVTKRALDKLSTRALSRSETARLACRRQKWELWARCASLEDLLSADLRARFVLESLLLTPLAPSPAREVARLSPRQQSAFGRELQGEVFPTCARELAYWVARNSGCDFWQRDADFPVNLARCLGYEGDSMPTPLQSNGPLALSREEISALIQGHPPEQVRQIAEFWAGARWVWPDARPLCALLKMSEAEEFGAQWRALKT